MIIAAAYVRVSTDEQTEYSPAAQLEDIKDFARKNGYHIPAEFIFMDEGISGKRADKRPAFQEMIRQAKKKSNHIQYIIVHKFDRFARNKDDSVIFKALLKKDGVKVLSVKEPIPDDEKFAVIYESMLEAMAEYYSLNLAEEVKKTMHKKAKMGEWQTTAPFGYRNENKTIAPEPKEAKMVRYIFEQYIAGESMFALSRHMNQMGFRTHRGNVFENRTIQYILNNPVYKGYMRWTPNTKARRNFNHPDTIIAKGSWEPIVTEEIWKAAADRIQRDKKTHYRYKRPETEGIHWLSSMVKCSSCERSLVFAHHNKDGSYSLQCGGYNHGQCHVSHSISTNRLIPAIFKGLDIIARNPKSTEVQYTIRHISKNTGEAEAYEAMIQKTKQKLQKAKAAYLNDVDSLEEYKANKQAIEKEIAVLQEHLSAAQIKQKKGFDESAFSAKIRRTLDVLQSDDYTMEEKRDAFKSVVEKIIYIKPENSLELFLIDG